MDPRYELPSRNYFAREALPQMYTEVRQSLAYWLASVPARTSDMWSSRTCEPYMSVAVHFIQDWEMKQCVFKQVISPRITPVSIELRPCRTQLQAGNSKKSIWCYNIVKADELTEFTLNKNILKC